MEVTALKAAKMKTEVLAAQVVMLEATVEAKASERAVGATLYVVENGYR